MTTHTITDTEIRLPSNPYIPGYAEGVAALIKARGEKLEVLEIAQKGLTTADWTIIFNALNTSNATKVHTLILPTLVTIPSGNNNAAESWMTNTKLTTVNVPNADKASRVILHLKRLYREAATLTAVEINDSDFDQADWSKIFAQLKEVKNLQSLSLPHFTGRVDNFDTTEAVLVRENLTNINLPGLDMGCSSWVLERLNKREDAAITHLVVGKPSNYQNTRYKVEGNAANTLPLLVSVVNKNPKIKSVDLTGVELFFPKEQDPKLKGSYIYDEPIINFSEYSFSGTPSLDISLNVFIVKNVRKTAYDFGKEKNAYIEKLIKFFGNAKLSIRIPEVTTFSSYDGHDYSAFSVFVEKYPNIYNLNISGHVFSTQRDSVGNRRLFSEIVDSAYLSGSLKSLNLSNCGIDPYLLVHDNAQSYPNKMTPAQALYNAIFSNTLEEIDLSGNDLRPVYYYQGARVSEGYLPPRALDFMDNIWGKPVSPAEKFAFDKAHFLDSLMRTKKLKVINLIGTGIGYDDIRKLVKENYQELTIKYSDDHNEAKDFKVPLPKIAPTLAQIFGITATQVEEPSETSTAAGSASMGAASSVITTSPSPSASDEKSELGAKERKELAVATFASEEEARSRAQAAERRAAYAARQNATAAVNRAVVAANTAGSEVSSVGLPPSYQHAISDAAREEARLAAILAANMALPESSPEIETLELPTPSAPPLATAAITASEPDATVTSAAATATTAAAPIPVPVPAPRARTETFMGMVTSPLASLMSRELDAPTTITGRLGTQIQVDSLGFPIVPTSTPRAANRGTPPAATQQRTQQPA